MDEVEQDLTIECRSEHLPASHIHPATSGENH